MIVQTLYEAFKGTPHDWLFTGNFFDRVHVYNAFEVPKPIWNLSVISTPIIDCLKTIVHYTIQLMESNLDQHDPMVRLALFVYYDVHAPLMCAFEDHADHMTEPLARKLAQTYDPQHMFVYHQSNLPDVNHMLLQCTYWDEQKNKLEPLVHLLTKGLPQRCQIRNLQTIISNYTQKDDITYHFLSKALLCSMLGNYAHSKLRPKWMARKQIIRRFIYGAPNRAQFQQWIFNNYQHLIFYTVKEYISMSMQFIPALDEVIRKTYNWQAFETSVHRSMDNIRMIFESNIYSSRELNSWFEKIETTLAHVNKQQLSNLYRPQRQTFAQAVTFLCEKQDEARSHPKPRVAFPAEYRLLLREMFKRIDRTDTVPIEWLKYFDVSTDVIDQLTNMQSYFHQNAFRTELKKTLGGLKRYDFEAVSDLFEVYEQTHHRVRAFPLPQHHYEKQLKALHRKYNVPEDQELPDYAGRAYLCLVCNTFKGFVIRPSDTTHTNLFANGHLKIIVDDETLKCYCGKRCDKNDSKKKRKRSTTATVRNNKKEFKNKRKHYMNEMCAHTECIEFNMTGMLLQFYGSLYTFCTECAGVTVFDPRYASHEGLVCRHCTSHGTFFTNIRCAMCNIARGKDVWETIQIAKDEESEDTEVVSICKTCFCPWMQDLHVPLTIGQLKAMKNAKTQSTTNQKG